MTATPYAAAGSLIPLLIAALARNRAATAVALLTTTALGFSVLPRAFGHGEADPGTSAPGAEHQHAVRPGRRPGDHGAGHGVDADVLNTQELTPRMVEQLDAGRPA